MNAKIQRLRELDAVDEMARRWDEYADVYNSSRLYLHGGVELSELLPASLRVLYGLSDRPTFGDLSFRRECDFRPAKAVDYKGESVYDGDLIRIGDVREQSLLIDPNNGLAMIYDYSYFKYDAESGVSVECGDISELVNTVALGPRYMEINGPPEQWDEEWWLEDPWYLYLVEIGMITDGGSKEV
ncbi:hypothetical protein [Nocardia colli]|uniref:hypothetical protein n=1 Tax=Nocardia colli TaxID=2545717 RepID=UPI0035DCFC95